MAQEHWWSRKTATICRKHLERKLKRERFGRRFRQEETLASQNPPKEGRQTQGAGKTPNAR